MHQADSPTRTSITRKEIFRNIAILLTRGTASDEEAENQNVSRSYSEYSSDPNLRKDPLEYSETHK